MDKLKEEGLYFVHGFYREESNIPDEYNEKASDHIILFQDRIDLPEALSAYDVPLNYYLHDRNLIEGDFVVFDGDTLSNAENNPISIMYKELTNQIIQQINYSNLHNHPDSTELKATKVHSYHINVGHGNCSIVVFYANHKWQMWMIDCSYFDFTNHHNNYSKIQKCLKNIENQYDVTCISKLLITHLHYDHINAIDKLITDGYITKNTEIWMNTYYPWYQPSYLRIQTNLRALNVKFIDPIISNSTEHINILYPSVSFDKNHLPPRKKINNASVIYQINFLGKSMLFPGDIETDGWNNVELCFPFLEESYYYCISHHGSITGHLRNECIYRNHIRTLADCNISRIQILMGRNNAYRGIYSQSVIDDFNNIYKVEDSENYIKIDWITDEIETY